MRLTRHLRGDGLRGNKGHGRYQRSCSGLTILEAGGDFADGVIAYEGNWLGGETFVSFDKKAVALLAAQGLSAQLL